MLPARGISKKSMAINRLNHSLNDSLESTGNGDQLYPSCVASVGPEEFSRTTDFKAFSKTEEESESFVYNLLPSSDFLLLQDRSSGKNRALAVEKLQAAIEGAKSTTVLESNLASLVEDACTAVSDSHIKVSLAGLQLLEPLIRRTGSSLTPHLPSLVEAMLGKMTTNKYVLKKAGMKMLVHLMHYSRPQDVTAEVAKFGLTHKHSKVREESLNVITAALIRFQKSEFRLIQLAKEIMPTLCDAKPRVRQACLECLAKIASLSDQTDFRQIVSFAVKNGHRSNERNDMAILEALNCRIVRENPPRLKEDGLVEHAMPVVGREIPLSEHGADVDWIRDGALLRSGNVPNGLEESSARKDGRFRPFRSAKKLPWEVDEAERSRKDGDATYKQLNGTADLSSTFTLPKDSSPLPHHRPHSSKLFAKEGSNSPPSHRPPTGRKRLGLSDMGGEAHRISTNSPNGSGTVLLRELRDLVPPTTGSLPPPIPPPGSKCSRRHQSLPNGVVNRDLQMRSGVRKATNFGNGSPKLSPIGSATARETEQQMKQQSQIPPLPSGGDEFSETWPRSRAGIRCKTASRKPPEELITADPMKAFGGELRPPSKPRVRNPITLKQRQEKKLKLLQQQLQNSPQDSPTATEQEFLMSHNTSPNTTLLPGGEDEYYSMVPEDNTALDNSLSCSLTSLCRPAREADISKTAEMDNLHYIRKEVASRKAQLLSTDCSTSNVAETHHSPRHDEIPVGPGLHRLQQENDPVYKREKSGVGIEKDFNKTFTAGESLAHIHPSATTWQTLQSLTETAPLAPVSDKPRKKTRKKKRKSGSDEGDGSSGGSNLTLEGGRGGDIPTVDVRCSVNHTQTGRSELPLSQEQEDKEKQRLVGASHLPLLKARFRRAGSLGPEGQRPSIERGGTNMVTMEVNGVKSPPPQLSPDQLSPVAVLRGTKEARTRKKRVSEPAFAFSETRAMVGPSKPPLPHLAPAFVGNESLESSCAGTLHVPEVSRPPPRKKHSKYAVTKTKDEYPQQHNSFQPNGVDEAGVVENMSPGGSRSCLPELQPFPNAERGLRESLDQMDNSDWNEKCEGIKGVRRLAMFHLERLLPELRTVTLAVVEEVKNLRSSVARAAIACLEDIFVYAGRYMDPDLDRVVKVLLHKAGESNVFIREDVEKTMCEIVQHATPAKLLLAIVSGGQSHRSIQVRRTTAQFLGQTVERYGPAQLLHASRDLLEKTLIATLNFIGDAAAEPRYYGRKCLSHLVTAADFEKVASRTLNTQQFSKLKDALETLRNKGVGEPPAEPASTRSRHPTGGTLRAASHMRGTGGGRSGVEEVDSKPRNSRRVSQNTHGGENPPLPDRLVEQLKADHWEDRKEAIRVLEKFVDRYPKALEPHMHKVFDAFSPRLTDRNSKVNLQALQAFSNMVPLLGNLLAPMSANVIKALMPNLASKNMTIHNAGMTVLDLISECVDPMCLIQPIATHSQHGNARVQPIMIRKLAELTREIYSQNAKQVTRQVLPVMWNLLAGKPPGSNDAKDAIVKLCESLFNTMGQNFLDSAVNLPPQSQRRLDQILQSRNFN